MERNEESFEKALRGLGRDYERMLIDDPDKLLGQLKTRSLSEGGRISAPRHRWWIAASALILVLGVGGGLLHQWTTSQAVGASVKLTYIVPKTKTTVVYATSSRSQEHIGATAAGAHATNLSVRSKGEISEVITPFSRGRYKIALTYMHMTSQIGNQPPQPVTALNGVVTTYLVSGSGQVLSEQVVPLTSADKGLLTLGKSVSGPLLPQMPKKALKPGQTWTADRSVTVGTASYKASTTYTYEGRVHGYLKIHIAGNVTMPNGAMAKSGKGTYSGYVLLDNRSHLLDAMTNRMSFIEQTTTPATPAKPASTETVHLVLQMSMRRVG